MWLLVLVLIPVMQGIDRMTVLETLPTQEACIELRSIVIEGMAQAYHDDHTYSIECRQKERLKPTRS